MSEKVFQCVDAHGIANAPFDRVYFTANTEVVAKTAALVKEALLQRAAEFKVVLEQIKLINGVTIDESSLELSSNVAKNNVYDNKKADWIDKGYKATYSVGFDLKTPDVATDVYDALTELKEFNVAAPAFHLKHQEALKLKALQNAYDRLIERFATECKIMGVNPDDYEVSTWRVNYGGAGGGRAAMASAYSSSHESAAVGAARDSGVEIQAAMAVVTVSLTVNYVRKEGKKNASNK